jgi:hypothetical protein
MRINHSAVDQVKEYAAERGCTEFDKGRWLFLAPNKLRSIRISEISTYFIYLWDTADGRISIPREGRNARIRILKAQGEAQMGAARPPEAQVIQERSNE